MSKHDQDMLKAVQDISKWLEQISLAIQSLKPKVTEAKFQLQYKGAAMPVTVNVGATGTSIFQEFAADGSSVAPIGPVDYASDNTAVATIDANGNWTAVGAGTCNCSALDTGNGLTASDGATVNTAPPPVATSATFQLIVTPTKRRK